ncbi:MAG: hypothetical protein Q9165_000040 [Trypethelium subeluteriae]
MATQPQVTSAPQLSLPKSPVQILSASSPSASVTSEVPTFLDTISENGSLSQQIASKTQQHEQLLSRYQAVVHDEEQSRVFYHDFPALQKSKAAAVSKAKVALEDSEQDLNNLRAQQTECHRRFALFLEKSISQHDTRQKNQNKAHEDQIATLQNQIGRYQADIQSRDEALKSTTSQIDRLRKDLGTDVKLENRELRKDLDGLRSSLKDALHDIDYLQADSDRLKNFRGDFTNADLEKMWDRSKSASEGFKGIRNQDLGSNKDIDELKSSIQQRLDSTERRLKETERRLEETERQLGETQRRVGETEKSGAKVITLGCKLEDLEKKADQIATFTSGGFDGLVQALANSAPSIITEMRNFGRALTEVKGDISNLKETLDQWTVDVEKPRNDRSSIHQTSLASSDAAMAPSLENSVETRKNDVLGRMDEKLEVSRFPEDLEIALTRVRQDNVSFVMKQLADFEEKIMHILREDTSQIRQDLTELRTRPVVDDISSFRDRIKLVEQKTDKFASKVSAQQSRHFVDRITPVESVLNLMSPNHDFPTESFGEPYGSKSPSVENLAPNLQPPLSSYAATGVGPAGEKFATVKFVQDRLGEVFIRINELRDGTVKYDEHVRKHDLRLDEICRSLETVRIPVQGLEKRFNELTTDALLSLIVHEISRTFPDARNLQQATNHFQRTMVELHSPTGPLSKQSRAIDQLLRDVHQLQQNARADSMNRIGNTVNVETIIHHQTKIDELDKARADFSQRLERIIQAPTTLSRSLSDEKQSAQNAQNGHNMDSDKLEQELDKLVKRMKEIEDAEGTTKVIALLSRLEQDVSEMSRRVGGREDLVGTVRGQVQSLEGQGNAQGDIVAKIVAAVDELNEKIGLPSIFQELT